ncbi:MAG: DNA polymerase III subunit beta [Saprospirales bacterium]|nr:DNA polymerase III subunit beta [Saprospirales bacterium]
MRLSKEAANFLKHTIREILPDAEVRLFGSRTDDKQRGGDIDILVIADRRLSLRERINIQAKFWEKFGEQKLDIASFTTEDEDTFKELAMMDSIVL